LHTVRAKQATRWRQVGELPASRNLRSSPRCFAVAVHTLFLLFAFILLSFLSLSHISVFLRFPLQFTLLFEPIDSFVHLVSLAIEEFGHRCRQSRVSQKMHTDGRLGIKAAQSFEVTTSARLKAHQLVANAMVNGC